MIKITSFILLLAISLPAAAQVSEPGATSAYAAPKKGDRPDIPGTITLELGLNTALDAPDRFDHGFWGSRTINVYYTYEMQIGSSNFSIVPGFGLSLKRFKFKNGATLGYDEEDSLKLFLPEETAAITGEKKSQLITNYFEVPLELRFTSNPDDPNRAFKMAFGGRIGYLYDAMTKMKYREEGETKQFKDKQNFNLNRFRYGIYGKLGLGNFSIFGYYNLTTLFEEGKGPYENNVKQDFQTMTIGISLSAF